MKRIFVSDKSGNVEVRIIRKKRQARKSKPTFGVDYLIEGDGVRLKSERLRNE